jgi:hypothetical protein
MELKSCNSAGELLLQHGFLRMWFTSGSLASSSIYDLELCMVDGFTILRTIGIVQHLSGWQSMLEVE